VANLVLTVRAGSGYDDVRELRYHFPQTYLNQARQGVGDYFVYYEPRREGGRESYVGWGRAERIEPDPLRPGHHYLLVSGYQDFPQVVPAKDGLERAVIHPDGKGNRGAFGRSVRLLPRDEFTAIVQRAFLQELADTAPSELVLSEPMLQREALVRSLTTRTVRDRAFARQVREAYAGTCALTGLRVANGGGWLEMEAAHILPVERMGPDSVRNGLALSRTMHALFDRGFVTLRDDYSIVTSTTHPLPEKILSLLVHGPARVPESRQLRPHPEFLRYHREHIFKDRAA
jgi:putative restriction endonuclease